MPSFRLIISLLCAFIMAACSTAVPADDALRYARWLTLTDSTAAVLNPWRSGEVLHEYTLRDYNRAVSATSLHAFLAYRLGAMDRLAGVMDADYIVAPELRGALSPDADMGSSQSPNLERIRAAGADLIFASPFENAGYGSLETLGIPIVECADYMETTPLGRAEWMRFYGRLLGRAAQADSLFERELKAYEALSAQAANAGIEAAPTNGASAPSLSAQTASTGIETAPSNDASAPVSKATVPEASAEGQPTASLSRPTVLLGKRTGQAWYVPGGESFMARLLNDAGAAYAFADEPTTGSLPLDFEAVYSRAKDADLWLFTYAAPPDADGTFPPMTYADLADDDERYTHFRAFREHRIWACNTLAVPYFDALPWAPSAFLRELMAIVRPDLLPDYALQYFRPLEP